MSDRRLIEEVVQKWKPGSVIAEIVALKQDASSRKYFRVSLGADDLPFVAVIYADLKVAEIGLAQESLRNDLAYVQLSKFFSERNIPVPEIYFEAFEEGVFFLEDLGDCLLGDLLCRKKEVEKFYKKAIDYIIEIQQISDPEFFAFKRRFTKEIYSLELAEFLDYYAKPRDLNLKLFEGVFEKLLEELSLLECRLAHRDFHSWNLILDQRKELRVIDFQDALLGPRCYDVVSLLNDRDTNLLLGERLYQSLTNYFFQNIEGGESLHREYYLSLLQRDLKVVGRFSKLVSTGRDEYGKWLPGTLLRVCSSLEQLTEFDKSFSEVGKVLFGYIEQS